MNIFLPDIMDNQLKSGIHLLHNFGCKINMSFCFFFDQFYVLQVIYICKWGRVETKQFEDEKTILWVERTQHKTDMMLTLFFNELNIFDWHRVFSFLFFSVKKGHPVYVYCISVLGTDCAKFLQAMRISSVGITPTHGRVIIIA